MNEYPKKIKVDDCNYVKDGCNEGERLVIICVDNRGLTFIGRCNPESGSPIMKIRDARCIIRWGTTQHIAELVDGPKENTKLGFQEDININSMNFVFYYDADENGWKGYV